MILHRSALPITQTKWREADLQKSRRALFMKQRRLPMSGGTGIKIDDLVETTNHFKCFDYILDTVNEPLTEDYIKTS